MFKVISTKLGEKKYSLLWLCFEFGAYNLYLPFSALDLLVYVDGVLEKLILMADTGSDILEEMEPVGDSKIGIETSGTDTFLL